MSHPLYHALIAGILLTITNYLAACSTPTSTSLALGSGNIILNPVVGAKSRGVLEVFAPYTEADVHHLVLKLYTVDTGGETPVLDSNSAQVFADIPSSNFRDPVTFSGLANNTTYRVKGFAYKAAGENFIDLISDESLSTVDVVVGNDSAPQSAPITIKLVDKYFEAQATAALSLTNGALVGVGVESITSAGYAPLKGEVTTFAGTGAAGLIDGSANTAKFSFPTSVAAGPDGSVFVADYSNGRVRKISPKGIVSTVAGGGGTAGVLSYPRAITSDSLGNLYIADGATVKKLSVNGGLTTIAGGSSGYIDGPAYSARFSTTISDLDLDIDGSLLVVDRGNNRLRRISTNGNVTTVAGSGGWGFTDGPALTATFYYLSAVEVRSDGYIYLAEEQYGKLRVLYPDGKVYTHQIGGGDKFRDIAFNSKGDMFLADSSHRIIFRPAGVTDLYVQPFVAPYNSPGFADGMKLDARFNTISGLCVDKYDTLYVADTYNNAVRRVR